MAERKHRHGKLYLLLMALAAAGAAIWVGSSVLSVEEFAFTGARLPAGWDGGRLVVLSDLHGKRFGRQNSRLLEAVRGAKPDAICLCGDMMDEWSGTEYLRPLLEGLVEIAPVYYVTGNHEWASGRMPEMRQLLEETGREGTGSYRVLLMDELACLTGGELDGGEDIEIFERAD